MKIAPELREKRFIERDIANFSTWNLQMLDMEKVDDPELLEHLDDFFLKPIYSKYSDISFYYLFGQLEYVRGFYGSDSGFHAGFGELLASLLIKDALQRKESDYVYVRKDRLSKHMISTHLVGI